jgi:hypothetical protein
MSIDPANVGALVGYSSVSVLQGKPGCREKAQVLLRKALAINPVVCIHCSNVHSRMCRQAFMCVSVRYTSNFKQVAIRRAGLRDSHTSDKYVFFKVQEL